MIAKLTETLSQIVYVESKWATVPELSDQPLVKRHKGTNGAPGARRIFELLETRDHLQQAWLTVDPPVW